MIKGLGLLGAGLTVLQFLIGVVLSSLKFLFLPHVIVGISLLILSSVCSWKSEGMIRRMCLGNVFLVILAGTVALFSLRGVFLVLHTFLALGVLSNFSVIYGFERGRETP